MKEENLKKLVKMNTVSINSNMQLIDFCADMFSSFGYKVDKFVTNKKSNLFAFKKCDTARIILSAHSDTVPPNNDWVTDPFILTTKDNSYFGLGVSDMKAFIAIMFDMAEKCNDNKLAFLITHDEETDFSGAKLINNKIIRPSDMVIIGEPTNGKIITGNKGVLAYRAIIKGVAGHGSNPNNGISAIEKAAIFINSLKSEFSEMTTEKDTTFSYPIPSMNFGTISGGSAINTIADETIIDFEFRITKWEQKIWIKNIIKKISKQNKINIKLQSLIEIAPFLTNKTILKEAKLCGIEISPGESYCTEANIFNKLSNNVLVFGPGNPAQAHKANENIDLQDITKYENKLIEFLRLQKEKMNS